MARTAKSAKAGQRTTRARKPGRPPTASVKPAVKGRTSKPARAAAAPKPGPAALPRAPKVSKDELRAQVEKLERANATLRAKSRETNRAAKSAAARIAEFEGEVARLEKKAASQAAKQRSPHAVRSRGGQPPASGGTPTLIRETPCRRVSLSTNRLPWMPRRRPHARTSRSGLEASSSILAAASRSTRRPRKWTMARHPTRAAA